MYITRFNANSVIHNMDIDDNIHFLDREIYKIDFKWFNKLEISTLLSFKHLYKDPAEFFEKYKKRDSSDTKVWVYEGLAPSYHHSLECERLNSDFTNYKIPKEIKVKGDVAIQEFRFWFKSNQHLLETASDLFFDKLKWKFNLIENPESYFKKNSGIEEKVNLSLDDLEKRIEKIISNANTYYLNNYENKIILNEYGKISYISNQDKLPDNFYNKTPYPIGLVLEVLKKFENSFKVPLKFLLNEYYRVKYNPNLKFEGRLLEQLGFKSCTSCKERLPLDSFFYSDEDTQFSGWTYTDSNDNYTPAEGEEEAFVERKMIDVIINNFYKKEILNGGVDLYGQIEPIRIEPSIVHDRNYIVLTQYYITSKKETFFKYKPLFYAIKPNSAGVELFCEIRSAKVLVPKHISLNDVPAFLNKYPNSVIYRVVSNNPIMTDSEVELYDKGLLKYTDIKSEQKIYLTKEPNTDVSQACFRYLFSKKEREDKDLR